MSKTPTLRELGASPVLLLAFGFGTGLSPKAPGTVGTLVGVPLYIVMMVLPLTFYLGIVAAMFVLGVWLCGAASKRMGVHDHGGIVWDEIVGVLLTYSALLAPGVSSHPLYVELIAGFVWFRIFDIAKPWPIGWLDKRVHGGLGIMIDDVIAGIFGAVALAGTLALLPKW